jgi:hypothetical protein
VSVEVAEPETKLAEPPLESARAGVPVTSTGSLKEIWTWTTSPAF